MTPGSAVGLGLELRPFGGSGLQLGNMPRDDPWSFAKRIWVSSEAAHRGLVVFELLRGDAKMSTQRTLAT